MRRSAMVAWLLPLGLGLLCLGTAEGQGLCSSPQPALVTDTEVRQTPEAPEPPARVPYRDPVFGTCQVRLTDRLADVDPEDPSAGLKNEYSRVQSFNADDSFEGTVRRA